MQYKTGLFVKPAPNSFFFPHSHLRHLASCDSHVISKPGRMPEHRLWLQEGALALGLLAAFRNNPIHTLEFAFN